MKKLLLFLLALFPITASADDSGSCGEDVTYTFVEATGTLTITGTGTMTDYNWSSVPWYSYRSKIKTVDIGNSVTSIGSNAFYDCSGLTSVTIPNSVTSIGSYVFYSCRSLTSVTIPNGVTSIGDYAFSGCIDLTSITVESGNTVYDSRGNCNAIIKTSTNELIAGCKNTIIPNSVTSIGSSAFYYCSGLTSVTIPNSVTSIGSNAFYNCYGLTSVTIPNSVTSIGSNAFEDCSGLTSVTCMAENVPTTPANAFNGVNIGGATLFVPVGSVAAYQAATPWSGFWQITGRADDSGSCGEDVTYTFVNATGTLTITGTGAMTDYTSISSVPWYSYRSKIKTVDIRNSVTSIGSSAFYDCSGLTSVTIPNSVTSIGSNAFEDCSGLTSVTCMAENVPTTESNAFNNVNIGNATLLVPAGSVVAYQTAAPWSGFGQMTVSADDSGSCGENVTYTFVKATGTLTITGTGAMMNYPYSSAPWYSYRSKIKTVDIGNSVTSIGSNAFYDCSGLTSVTIPNSVTSIGSSAFYYCSGLTSVTIPNSVTSIGWNAFEGCSGLTSVTIPNSVTSISSSAFSYCSCLTSITVESDNTVYDSRGNCNAIINTSTNQLIAGCKNTIIPNSVMSIGNSAFYGCSGLTSVTIPNSVRSIGSNAFEGCSGLSSVTISNYVTSIDSKTFSGCSGLTSVTIPNRVTSIGWNAFEGCSGLTSVTIPNSVTSIGYGAFSYCSCLTSITVESGNTVYDSRGNCNAIIKTSTGELIAGCKNTIIPNSVTSIGNGAFYGCSGLTSVTIPNSVTSIGNDVFANCSGLTSVTIPNYVTSIGSNTFSGCSGLTSVTCLAENVPTTISSAFENVNIGNAALFVPAGSVAAYQAAAPWSGFGQITASADDSDSCGENVTYTFVEATGTLTIIGTGAMTDYTYSSKAPWYSYRNKIKTVGIGNSVTSIGNEAFYDCTDLTSVTIPNCVTSIGSSAFESCSSLLSVTVEMATPITITSSTFSNRTNATLFVPSGCRDAYLAADYWKEFKDIVEMEPENTTVEVTDISQMDNVIFIEPMEETKGSEVVVPILMKNTAVIRGFQFDLYLPNGVTLAKTSKGKYVCSLSNGRLPEDDEHTLTLSEQEDGAIRFLCGSQYNETFTGNEGEIATMKLLIAEDIAEGNYPIVLKKVKLSETNISNYYLTETVQTSLTVISYIPGDISGDGEVDVSDYIGVANFIMGDTPEGFIEAAADVNKDKVVDVSDYIGVANIILYGNIYGPMANASRSAAQMENSNSSASDNLIYIEPFKADANSQATVSFKMKNSADIRGFQFDLYLPKGISVVKDAKNRIQGLLANERKPEGDQHTLTLSEQEDGAIRFLCASMYDETFTGYDGEVATLTVNIAENMAEGDYPILLKKMKLSETNIGNCYETESRMATITISNNSATGIRQLATDLDSETYYNLQGQRVSNPAKGVFIKNGKKVMMK